MVIPATWAIVTYYFIGTSLAAPFRVFHFSPTVSFQQGENVKLR